MKRYLLFDADCVRCSHAAASAELAASGWLTTASLSDPKMQELLGQCGTGRRRWEPTLLEVSDTGSVRAFTGSRLSEHLLRHLGVRRSMQVLRGVRASLSTNTPSDEAVSVTRRRILQWTGGALGVAVLATGWPITAHAATGPRLRGGAPAGLKPTPIDSSTVAKLAHCRSFRQPVATSVIRTGHTRSRLPCATPRCAVTWSRLSLIPRQPDMF